LPSSLIYLFMRLSSRHPTAANMNGKGQDAESLFRRFDRVLATRYAREHMLKENKKRRAATSPQVLRPRMDLCDDPQSSVITASLELPGLKPNQITIQLQDEKLMVSGERCSPLSFPRNPGTTYPVQEVKYGVFRRVIELPQGVQASQMSASMCDGILVLSWPRDPQRLPPIRTPTLLAG